MAPSDRRNGRSRLQGVHFKEYIQATLRTIGVEVEANVRPVSLFELSATGTYQDPKFKNYTFNTLVGTTLVSTSFDDNRPSSMPKVMFSVRPQLHLWDDRLRVLGEWRHKGNKFNDDANVVKLPAFDVFNASVQLDLTENLTLSIKGNNLSNSLGLGQGGGGQAIPGQYDGNVILARPIFGRNFQGSALFKF